MNEITCQFCGDKYPNFDVAHMCSSGEYAPKLKSTNPMNDELSKRIDCLFDEVVRLKLAQAKGTHETPLAIAMYKDRLVKLIANECVMICDSAANIAHTANLSLAEQLVVAGAKNQAMKLSLGIKQYFGIEE